MLEELLNSKELRPLLRRLAAGNVSLVSGMDAIHKAHLSAALRKSTERFVVVVVAEEVEAGRFRSDISAMLGVDAFGLPAREFTFYNADIVSRELEHERLRALFAMLNDTPNVLVTTPDGLMQRTLPPDALRASTLTLEVGQNISIPKISEFLVNCGYVRSDLVEGVGQFAVRGGILDFFSPIENYPVRVEFFGDEIDSIGTFDPDSQRRVDNISSATILPASETQISMHIDGANGFISDFKKFVDKAVKRKSAPRELKENLREDYERVSNGITLQTTDRYMELIYSGNMCSGIDYLPENALIVLCEPSRVAERAKNYHWRISEDTAAMVEKGIIAADLVKYVKPWEECLPLLPKNSRAVVMTDSFRVGVYPFNPRITLTLTAKHLPNYGGSLPTAADDIRRYLHDNYRIIVLTGDERKAGLMLNYLHDVGISASLDYKVAELPSKGHCVVGIGGLSAGMEYPNISLAVITEGQLFQSVREQQEELFRKKLSKISSTKRQKLQTYSDLSVGDLVVHEQHGIGRFLGMIKMRTDDVEKEYIQIEYRGSHKLYVPTTQLDLVTKYIGGGSGDSDSHLSKLGGNDWNRAKSRAKAAARDMADELVKLYAERSRRSGFAFSEDSGWQREFEDSFAYKETEDQLKAIAEIKKDMEKPVPMDRLLCGDVGFGKTEVALRAVMKCVSDGKQAAVLVPTTVLAQQHYLTTMQRFQKFPVKTDLLNRFKSPSEVRQTIKELSAGSVDVIIGTHRLLSQDIKFRDLGLIVVDEEQRFGVAHKEKLKQMAKQVDVLMMSATPIPRTLNMALSGLRDMSNLEQPPTGRHPVQTYVLEHDWSIIADAIRREIGRGGQVFYLHNRIDSIDRTVFKLREELHMDMSELRIGVAHGAMTEDELSDVMEQVSGGQIQVLVCTTIIEAGIDIANVNTLIVEDADRLGLAQLHQIRGRVGRSSRRAFAYFTFRKDKVLSDVANKRLSTMREFAAFNSGMKIAMRDLEIRGAGNLLGSEQSGHMHSVGFDMYLKLLEEAVLEEKGETVNRKPNCSADLSVSANIPEDYIASAEQRMDIYRRIAMVNTQDDAYDMLDELCDRYGDPPDCVTELIDVALLRGVASTCGISEIKQSGNQIIFELSNFDTERLMVLFGNADYSKRFRVERGADVPTFTLKTKKGLPVVEDALAFVKLYGGAS